MSLFGQASQPSSSGTGFSFSTPQTNTLGTSQPTTTPLFGTTTTTATATPATPATSTNLFGTTTTSTFNNPLGLTSTFNTNNDASATANTSPASSRAGTPPLAKRRASTTATSTTVGGGITSTSIFGSSNNQTQTSAGSLFSSSTSSKPINSLFQSSTQQQQQQQPTNGLFQSNNQQQQTQQTASPFDQSKPELTQQGLLDLQSCFSDKTIPQFIITPNNVTHSSVSMNAFVNGRTRDITSSSNTLSGSDNTNNQNTLTEFVPGPSLGDKRKVTYLPALLTAPNDEQYGHYDNDKPLTNWGKKMRLFDDNSTEGHKKAKSLKGVFADSHDNNNSFDRTLTKYKDVDVIPTKSITEVGIQPTRFKFGEITQKEEDTASAPFYTKAIHNESGKTRVRVFGFDPTKTEAILKYFMTFGSLIEPCSSQGNWITFNYTTHEAALKALACHGKLLHQRMIGVVWDDTITEFQTVKLLPAEDIFLQSQTNNLDKPSSVGTSNNATTKDGIHAVVKPSGFLYKIREILMGW